MLPRHQAAILRIFDTSVFYFAKNRYADIFSVLFPGHVDAPFSTLFRIFYLTKQRFTSYEDFCFKIALSLVGIMIQFWRYLQPG